MGCGGRELPVVTSFSSSMCVSCLSWWGSDPASEQPDHATVSPTVVGQRAWGPCQSPRGSTSDPEGADLFALKAEKNKYPIFEGNMQGEAGLAARYVVFLAILHCVSLYMHLL